MLQDCKTNGFDIPEFIVTTDIVKVTFPNLVHLREGNENPDDLKHYFEGIIEGIAEGITEGIILDVDSRILWVKQ